MIFKVTKDIFRGPRLNDLGPLKELGIKTILNLEDDMKAVATERALARWLDINFKSIPMSEIKRPSSKMLSDLVRHIENCTLKPIYVHCRKGEDRTGYVIAAYREIVQGWTFKKAYQEAKDYGHSWWFAPYLLFWPRSLKELK